MLAKHSSVTFREQGWLSLCYWAGDQSRRQGGAADLEDAMGGCGIGGHAEFSSNIFLAFSSVVGGDGLVKDL